jgi:arsenate reductase (thioredoxin)
MDKKAKVLFLTRGNASRGLMAEGFLRVLAGDGFHPVSAGTDGGGVNPLAAEVMREVGIDISTQKPNAVAAIFRDTFQFVVALCDESHERYPLFPFTGKLLRWSVADPEAATGGPEEQKQAFRQVRDQLRDRVEEFVKGKKHVFGGARSAAA